MHCGFVSNHIHDWKHVLQTMEQYNTMFKRLHHCAHIYDEIDKYDHGSFIFEALMKNTTTRVVATTIPT